MTANDLISSHAAYRASGVDTDEADLGLDRLVKQITRTWPPRGEFGGVQLEIGYFANVINIGGGMGVAIAAYCVVPGSSISSYNLTFAV